jgi:hypothetical protein
MGVGLAVASGHWAVAVIVGVYLAATLWAAIRTEEAYLRATFGATYDRYSAGQLPSVSRRFSVERALRNKEYRAPLGLLAVSLFLVWRAIG